MRRFMFLILLLLINLQPAQLSALELTTFLRSLRSAGVGSFPSLAHLRSIEEGSSQASVHFTVAGVTLQALGEEENQTITTLNLAIADPANIRQNDRWITLIDATLSVLKPQSSAIERLMVIQRTIAQDSYAWQPLTLSVSWQDHGYTFSIALDYFS